MKPQNVETMNMQRAILSSLKTDRIVPRMRSKYLVSAPFKFNGKKRSPSNSGGVGRRGRRRAPPYMSKFPGRRQ